MNPDDAKMLGEIHADVRWLKSNFKDHNERLRKVERRSYILSTLCFVCAAVAAKLGLPDLTWGILPH